MNEVVVLTYLDKIYERKFKIKILVKFKKNSMCSIEMKPLCEGLFFSSFSCRQNQSINLAKKKKIVRKRKWFLLPIPTKYE